VKLTAVGKPIIMAHGAYITVKKATVKNPNMGTA